MTKTKLGGNDFTCNPYVGCTHGCTYCYAKTIDRNHPQSMWGEFVDIKHYQNTFIPKGTGSKSLFFSSMTDPYQPIEKVMNLTQSILESIQYSDLSISFLTKSDLIVRDIDILKNIKHLEVGFSLSLLDEDASILESNATPTSKRIEALKQLNAAGITTYVFISPIIPYISQPFWILDQIKNHVNYVMFDTLNLSNDENRQHFFEIIRKHYPDRLEKIVHLFTEPSKKYYYDLKRDLIQYCEKESLNVRYIYY